MRAHLPGGLRLDASVVTIGAFDGVHRGHQALICAAIAKADSLGTPSVAVTFDPPPKAHFAGAAILTAIDEKLRRLAMLGVDHAVVIPFGAAYAAQEPSRFLADLFRLGPETILVGADFRFGARRAGNLELLARYFDVEIFPQALCSRGESISSSRIRALLARGELGAAEGLLGRWPDASVPSGLASMFVTDFRDHSHASH
jgi:riboflavin kinase / FMN adenylyltransferase